MNKKNWKQDFKNNYIFESEMGVHVHFVGQNKDLAHQSEEVIELLHKLLVKGKK